MTLNKVKTDTLKSYLHQSNDEVAHMMFGTPYISDTDYAAMRSEFQSWETAYNAGNLYGTNQDNTTFQFTGIDQFPVPPQR